MIDHMGRGMRVGRRNLDNNAILRIEGTIVQDRMQDQIKISGKKGHALLLALTLVGMEVTRAVAGLI